METKNNEEFVKKTLLPLKLPSCFLVPTHGHSGGGLALYWNEQVEVEILSSSDNFIDTEIFYQKKRLFITFTYGAPDVADRRGVWSQISSLAYDRDAPWLLTGDFNDIVDNQEKLGGPNRPESSFSVFRNFLSENDLSDIKYSGNCLSWRGKRGDHTMFARLDRSLSNSSWMSVFPSTACEYLNLESSDHRPVVTYLSGWRKKREDCSGMIGVWDRIRRQKL